MFVGEGPGRIGHIYHKARFIGYTDDSFTTPLPVEDPSRGILGPIIHAEVGDTIDVVYQNHTTVPTSVHSHGVFYDKGSEGSMTLDGTSAEQMADDHVPPGGSYTYHWSVPERAGRDTVIGHLFGGGTVKRHRPFGPLVIEHAVRMH